MVDIYFEPGNPITGSKIRIVEENGAETRLQMNGGPSSLRPTKQNPHPLQEVKLEQGTTLDFGLGEDGDFRVFRAPGRTHEFAGTDAEGKNKFNPLPTSPKRSTAVDDTTLQSPTVAHLSEGLHTVRYRGQELLKINVRG
jgi:hypothetical protein